MDEVTVNITDEITDVTINVIDGEAGASAYEIALENGFEGTVEDWLLSLKGDDGVALPAVTQTIESAAQPAIDTDACDFFEITAQATNITSMSANLTGTKKLLWLSITDNGMAKTIAWGAKFEASTVALPATTVASTRLDVGFIFNSETNKYRCVAVA